MTALCFIANYHLTPLQIELARRLQAEGHHCVFIAVNSGLAADLQAAGHPAEAVLHLRFDPPADQPVFDALPIRFNDLVLADRALRHQPDKALRFLWRAADQIRAFLARHRVEMIFSEPTWAHERLTAQIAAADGRRFLTPFTTRYPAGHWGFFADGDQQRLLPVPAPLRPAPTVAEVLQAGPPAYLRRNDQILRETGRASARLARLRRFLTRERIDPFDPTHIQSRLHTLRVKGGEELNRLRYRRVPRRTVDVARLGSPFVIYALHKQPESSIDVLGRYYEDQSALIMAIWRSLPPGWRLLVKEHTNAIGDRPPGFYRALAGWPGLEIIDEAARMADLLDHARAVFTVSGTVAYEAAMQGVASFTFAPMFFNCLPRSRRIHIEDLRAAGSLAALIDSLPAPDAAGADAALAGIAAHAFPGRFTDVVSDPGVMEADNLDRLMDGFRALLAMGPD